MIGRHLWVVLSSLIVIVDGFFLPAITNVSPSLLIVALLITAAQASPRFYLTYAFWLGFLMEVASVYPFGIHLFTALAVAAVIYWFRSRVVSGEGFFTLVVIIAPAILVQSILLFGAQGLEVIMTVNISSWFLLVLGRMAATLVFAWLAAGRVQLRV